METKTFVLERVIPKDDIKHQCYEINHKWEDTNYVVSKMEVGYNTDTSKSGYDPAPEFYFLAGTVMLQQCKICGVLRVKRDGE